MDVESVCLWAVQIWWKKATLFLHKARSFSANASQADVEALTTQSNDMIDALRAFISSEDSGMFTDGKPCYALLYALLDWF
jgi:hypothetical protein